MSTADAQLDLIDETTAADALVTLGLIDAGTPVQAQALSGGISNVVLAANWPGGRAVLKQSLPKLRVAADWSFDRARILNERHALELLEQRLPEGSVPAVLGHDDDRFLLAMAHAPDGGRNWKTELLAGRVDLVTAGRVGTMLGLIHARTADDPGVAECFGDALPLLQGRVDPYHRAAAAANPDVAAIVAAEVERLLATREVLVLGDWSPKNLLVYDDHVVALDLEVAHLGDPAFDVAFLLTHLVLKGVHRPASRAQLRQAADAFLRGYIGAAGWTAPPDAHVVAEIGCLLLARVDGMSPAEYLTPEGRTHVHGLALDVLTGGERHLTSTLDHLLTP